MTQVEITKSNELEDGKTYELQLAEPGGDSVFPTLGDEGLLVTYRGLAGDEDEDMVVVLADGTPQMSPSDSFEWPLMGFRIFTTDNTTDEE